MSYFCLLPYEQIIIIALQIWDIMESVTVAYTASMNPLCHCDRSLL